MTDLTWRTSTYSGGEGGECVEVASAGAVLVRDTTDRAGITLSVPAAAWRAFISGPGRANPDSRPRAPRSAWRGSRSAP